MSCYFIAHIRIHDRKIYDNYLAGYDEVFAKYKGDVLVVDDEPFILEGDFDYTRIVMIRFPNYDEARRWYDSPEYQALAQHRHKASTADIILAEGRD